MGIYSAVPLSHFSFPLIVVVLSDFSQGHFEVLPAGKDTTPHKEIFKKLHFKRRGGMVTYLVPGGN